MKNPDAFNAIAGRIHEFIRTPDPSAFENLALELFRLQIQGFPHWAKFCRRRGVSPEAVTDWRQIPPWPVAAFKAFPCSSIPETDRARVFHSSGTTAATISRHYHHANSLALSEASLKPWFAHHLLTGLDEAAQKPHMISFTPPPTEAPASSLVYMLSAVRGAFGSPESAFVGQVAPDGGWSLNLDLALAFLQKFAAGNRPAILLGTAFNYVHLLDALAQQNRRFRLPPDSRVLETGGYKGRSRSIARAELHRLIQEYLGIAASHIVGEYGMCELSSQAYDSRAGASDERNASQRVFRFPPWCRVRLVSPENGSEMGEGESGMITVFDLANVWSAMALQTEDLGMRCGDGFVLLGRNPMAEPKGCSLLSAEGDYIVT